ncbi:hypothetical protein SAMN05444339_10751 [Loktanella atrilutea]|uniref:Aspartate/glutamate racemase n=1 Tax=Loktanella atrilutea TaxID=366533 RepID=A0A1M5C7L1_LOKAT|nr:hypothetical protein [Loktanella atrilutea]SHF50701.1 hypothetical protein SAMN05444339_10751 [Loktanella atrilutea]
MTRGFIGVLSLDTRFPRILGDAGHPDSYHLTARVRVVPGAGPTEIVRDGRPSQALTDRFIAAARALEAEGAVLLTSTCGFLVTVQAEIAAAVRIPVLVSSLSLVPLVRAATGGRLVGIVTASTPALGSAALAAAGIEPGHIRIAGLQNHQDFAATFLAPKSAQPVTLDQTAIATAVATVARALVDATPKIGAIVLECGNLPPYADALRRATGRPVFTILDGARLLVPSDVGSGQIQISQLG